MRLDRHWAKFHLKSDSNRLLIKFFDPISAARFTRHDTKFDSEFEFDQKYIEFDRKWTKTTGFLIKFDIIN